MAVVASAEAAARASERGATLIQLRAPGLTRRQLYDECRQTVAAVRVPVLVSSDLAVALTAGAAGVNLPEADVIPADARRLLGPEALVGRSVHSLEGAGDPANQGADYLLLGPIFPTPSHPARAGLGLNQLAAAARLGIPVLGIGGMTATRARACLEAGAAGYAGIRMFQ